MSNRVLRIGAGLLVVAGLAVHLILGAMVGLGLLAAGLALHVAGVVAGRRWLRRHLRREPAVLGQLPERGNGPGRHVGERGGT